MDRLARAVKLAAKYREESFDRERYQKAIETHPSRVVDSERYYQLTMHEAADKAAGDAGYDMRGADPIYLLLKYCWNDILEWAGQFD